MAWLACDEDGSEFIYCDKLERETNVEKNKDAGWTCSFWLHYVELPKGSIEKLIGRPLKWDDDPVELG